MPQPPREGPRAPDPSSAAVGGVGTRSVGAGPVAEALCIGDELLSGDTVNKNAAFLGVRARSLGVPLVRVVTVRDRVEEIVEAARAAADRCDVVLVSGGLGPTTDDLTT